MAISGELITCKKGHHYDPEKYCECPTCKRENAGKDVGCTKGSASQEKPVGIKYIERSRSENDWDDEDVTVCCAKKVLGFDPITGWLVCIDGECKGKDYAIKGGRNYIGRDKDMDICIADVTVSRTNHASVSFDDKTGKFYYSPGMGRSIDHINDNPVFATVELKKGDQIEIGTTKLVFVPLCGSSFKWEDWNENEEEQ